VFALRTRSSVGCRSRRPELIAMASVALVAAAPASAQAAKRVQTTQLISRSVGGGLPNGPSTNGVISGDRRYARVIAFQSAASNLVGGDRNGRTDVFAVRRAGRFGNNGGRWKVGRTSLLSRGLGGQGANGSSWGAAVGGGFTDPASCVAFLSAASNLVRGDTNGRVDAFLSKGPGRAPKRVSKLNGRQPGADTTEVAVNGNCKRIAFVTGGFVFVRKGKSVRSLGPGADPSWSTGRSDQSDLVYTAPDGVRLSRRGKAPGALVGPGGRNPVYNNVKRRVLAYELNGQVVWKDLGSGLRLASGYRSSPGNGYSSKPVIGNSGYYVAFESRASNLQTGADGGRVDNNGASDVYLFTGVRKITLLQSVKSKGVALPRGGANPSMSFYANYILWDAPAPLGSGGPRQVYMRWLGSA
jgi:hypothetical protein